MDGLLSNFLFETYPINVQTSGDYKVVARENQVIDVIEKPSKKTTDPLFFNYFRQPVADIDREIGTMKLMHRKAGVNVDSGFREIMARHQARCTRAGLDASLFTTFIDSLTKASAPFRKQVEVATSYNYKFTYSASSSWHTWSKRGTHFKDLRTGDSVDNKALIDEFNNKLKKAKNGKYNMRINSSKLNDSIFGPHIDTLYRKYKYLSHIGFSVGNFITGQEFSTKNETIDGSLIFFDIFLIYHHYGLFGGFASKSVVKKTNIDGYFEGGVYLAPGNYFFFKLGVAKANNQINGIAGASLIFPVFQIEAGYNFALRNAFIMMGFNVPFNQ
jgi:hypothetical protein